MKFPNWLNILSRTVSFSLFIGFFLTSSASAQWVDLDGPISGAGISSEPECTSYEPNQIDCFARGNDNAVYHRRWGIDGWGLWKSLGGNISGSPKCVASQTQKSIDCFARGPSGDLVHIWWNGNAWRGPETLNGQIVGDPHCISHKPGVVDCFAQGVEGSLQHIWWNGSAWRGWESLGGPTQDRFEGAPNCTTGDLIA